MGEFLALVAVLVIAAAAAIFLKPSYEIVPQEDRLVIYRLGHFHRIAGPGMVWRLRRFDTIERRFSTRNEPQDCHVDGLLVYGVPIGLTLNIWWCYDPQRAAAGNQARLTELALFEESERRRQLIVRLKHALVQQINLLEQRQPLGATATIMDKIIPILPGVPTCVDILRGAQQDLLRVLPAQGLYLDTNQPFVITQLHPPEDLVKGFSRGRAAELLRLQLPDLPDSMLVHMLESIEGLDPLRVHEIRQVGANMGAGAETRWTDDDGTMFRVPLASGAPPQQEKSVNHGEAAVAPPPPTGRESLTSADLALLKRVPRDPQGQRRAA